MRIGIDARFYGRSSKGLGRYTQQLIKHLEQIDQENDYVIFLRDDNFDEYQPTNPRFRKVRANFTWYSFAEQLILPFVLYRACCDIVHFPHFNVPLGYRRRFVVTIHDLILLSYPTVRATTRHTWVYRIKFWAYQRVIASAIARAQTIFAVSQFTKQDILTHYRDCDAQKIVVTYESATKFAQTESTNKIPAQYGIIKPYILYVGNAYPHKNLSRLIRAFAGSKSAHSHQLILVGRDDFFYRRVMRQFAQLVDRGECGKDCVVMIPDVSDAELSALYHHAIAFVFPSLYEGFGLPPLEAMQYHLPVISSNHDCMREILGDAAHYFDAQDVASIMRAIDLIVQDASLRTTLINRGKACVARYDWHQMAQQTFDVYRRHTQ